MVKSFTDDLLVPFAKYLEKYGTWDISTQGASMLIPHSHFHFDKILFLPRRLYYSADKTWNFIASVPIIFKNQFTQNDIKLYQNLKCIEAEVKKLGLIKKKFRFQEHSISQKLQEEIPSFEIRSFLTDILNEDRDLIELMSNISPENLQIQLYSPKIQAANIKEYINQFKIYYWDPEEIIWNIAIEKFLDTIISKKTYILVLDSIIRALDLCAIHVIRATNIVKSRM